VTTASVAACASGAAQTGPSRGLTVFLKSYGRVFAFKSTCEEEAHSRRPVPRPLGFGERVG
jgi:hypothetical protein